MTLTEDYPEISYDPWIKFSIFSLVVFTAISRILESLSKRYSTSRGIEMTLKHRWRIRNEATSLVHSTVSGFWAVTVFIFYPDMYTDMIHSFNWPTYYLIAMTLGYFVYDVVDMIANEPFPNVIEMLIHHSTSVICFGISLRTGLFAGFGAVSLLLEISSVFLHIRLLLKLHNFDIESNLFRIISVLNVGCFLIFRTAVLGWMVRWLLSNKHLLAPYFWITAALGLAIMNCMSMRLLYRLLITDFANLRILPNSRTKYK